MRVVYYPMSPVANRRVSPTSMRGANLRLATEGKG